MTTYLTVFKFPGGKHFLEMIRKDETCEIMAFETLNEAAKRFEPFHEAMTRDHAWATSAGFGILQISPHIIKVPEGETAEWLRQFVIDERLVVLSGLFHPHPYALEVKPEIMEHSVLDIAKNVIDVAYGKDV